MSVKSQASEKFRASSKAQRAMRPRERMLLYGAASLSHVELFALLIGSGPRGESAIQVAERLYESYGSDLHRIGRTDPQALKLVRGIGDARAVQLVAAMELGRRRMEQLELPGQVITSARQVAERFRPRLCDLAYEEFWILALTRANTPIMDSLISRGGVTGTVADPKVIFSRALSLRAAAIILVHNHPSGNVQPSMADRTLTKRLQEAGQQLDLPVLDHVIIAGMRHFGFAEHGLL